MIDEENDGGYRAMSAPVFDSRLLAEWWMRANDGLCCGQRTPEWNAAARQTKELNLLELPKRVISNRMRVETQAARNQWCRRTTTL